ncbi:MAG: ABC transporter ATP-binding protein [Clostridia bacterium]|nr:ABC transporter ATP-binding protein [Clostridia bacterium]
MIKKLAKCLREYKKDTLLTVACMVVEAGMEILIPFLISLFGKEINAGNMNGVYLYGALMVGAAIVSLLAGMFGGKFCARASTGFAKNLRRDMYVNVQSFSFSNIDRFSSGSLVTRLTTDITNVQMAFMMLIRTAIRCPLMLIFSIVMSFAVDTTLPVIFFVTIPILAGTLTLVARLAFPTFKRLFTKYDALNSSVDENIKGMRVVKAYVREEHETHKFKKVSNELRDEFTRAERLLALNSPVMQICMYGALIAVVGIGANLILHTNTPLQYTDLQSLIMYSFQILMSLMMLSMIFVMVILSLESGKRICEVLDEKSDLDNPENPVTEVKNGDVEFRNVSFRYSEKAERDALESVSFKIHSGETIGIIGGTGASKTTLVNLISRLYDVTDGEVLVGDVDVRDYDMNVLRKNVAVVLQKNMLFSGTIAENLRWGDPEATDEQVEEAAKLAQAHEFILQRKDGYDTMIEQGGTNVSGGQRQRLCIARALLMKPKVLILDDSTSAVDMKTDADLRKAFKAFIPETTKIIIAQRIASVQDADRIIIMDNGKINAIGTHEELLAGNSIYQEVYYSQNKTTEKGGND